MQLLRDIALFVEVVNTKSFTLAADHLDMPASTLSRRISLLEQSIGLRLLNRTTRRVEVTDAGAAYYAKCVHLVEEARVAHEDLVDNAVRAKGTLRLSCSHDFATHYLPEVLADFTRSHSGLSIELDLSSRRVDLVAENFDAALRLGKLPDSTLVARKLGALQSGLYAAPVYLRDAPPLREPADLAQHMCIRMNNSEKGSVWTLYGTDDSTPQRIPVQGRFCMAGMSLIRQLVLRGGGIGVIDEQLANDDKAAGRLLRVLPDWNLAPTPLHLLTPSRLMPARVRLFGDFLAERLAR